MHLRKITLFLFICLFFSGQSQNLIKNPCFYPSDNKKEEYIIHSSEDNIQHIITNKCVHFYYDKDEYIVDTSNNIIEDWKEFNSYSNYYYNKTKHDSGWYLCQEKVIENSSDSCFIVKYSSYNVWFDERIFLGGTLSDPLVKGKSYKFSIRIKKIPEVTFSVKEISVLFSEKKDSLNFFLEKQLVPTKADIVFSLNNDTNWQYCEKPFIANGYEKYFYIGIMKEQVNKIDPKNNAPELYFKYLHKKRLKDKNKQCYINELNRIYGDIFYIDYSNFEKLGENTDYILYWFKDFKLTEVNE